jgi:hypothetical protein
VCESTARRPVVLRLTDGDQAKLSNVWPDMTRQPKALRDLQLVAQRRGMLHEPHVRGLTEFVEDLQRQRPSAEIPFFDPADGGIAARVLFLLEAPGPNATGSGFVSRDNPDETAANIWTMSREVGLNRTECVIWNVCPWYVGPGGRIRAVRAAEVREAAESLRVLLGHLSRLQCVALVGRKAQLAEATVAAIRPGLKIVEMFHPSPSFVNRAPGFPTARSADSPYRAVPVSEPEMRIRYCKSPMDQGSRAGTGTTLWLKPGWTSRHPPSAPGL